MAEKDVVPRDISDILAKLHFIGLAQKGKKANFRTRTYSDISSWSDWLLRQFSSESHVDLESNLNTDITMAINLLSRYANRPEYEDWVLALLNTLETAKKGMRCFADTYAKEGKAGTVATINALSETIDIQIAKYRHQTRDAEDQGSRAPPGTPLPVPLPQSQVQRVSVAPYSGCRQSPQLGSDNESLVGSPPGLLRLLPE